MTEKEGDEAAPEAADVPPTRKHEVAGEPPERDSRLSLESIVLPMAKVPANVGYAALGCALAAALLGWVLHVLPHLTEPLAVTALMIAAMTRFLPAPRLAQDGPVSQGLRAVDYHLGLLELALLLAILVAVVLVGSLSALSGHLAHHQIGQWWNFVVRKGTFAIALLGAAYATHQQRQLAMDLISRRLPPRGRLVLGLLLALFTTLLAGVLFYIGKYIFEGTVAPGAELHLGFAVLTDKDAIAVIPAGAALIALHSLLHAAMDVDYLVRNQLPPERARSGH